MFQIQEKKAQELKHEFGKARASPSLEFKLAQVVGSKNLACWCQTAFQTLFALDLWRAWTFLETRQLKFSQFGQALSAFTSRLPTAPPLTAQMASHFFLEHFWLESVTSKNPRMHTGANGDPLSYYYVQQRRNWTNLLSFSARLSRSSLTWTVNKIQQIHDIRKHHKIIMQRFKGDVDMKAKMIRPIK